MPTIIDSLLVTLGLDSSEFKKGTKEVSKATDGLKNQTKKNSKEQEQLDKKTADAQNKRAKEIQKQAKESADSLKKIRNQAIGLAALFTGGLGLVRFTENTISSAASVGRLSSNIGESIETIVGMQRAFENVGGTADEATQSMMKASQAIGDFRGGRESEDIKGFLRAGGSIDDPKTLSGPMAFMLAKADLIQKLVKQLGERQAFANAQSFMGMGQNEFNLLKQGSGAVRGQVGTQGALAGINAKTAQQAAALQVKLNTLRNTFSDVSRTVLLSLVPTFERLLKYFQQLASWIDAHKEDITKWVDQAVTGIVKLAKEADKLAQMVGGWKNVLEGLVAIKFVGLLSGLGSVLTAVTAITSATGLAGVGLAGIGGYAAGNWLSENFIEGTKFGDFLGRSEAGLLSVFGNQDARESLGRDKRYDFLNKNGAGVNSSNSDPVRASASAAAGNSMSTEAHIENINIVTQATDAAGISRAIKPSIEKYLFLPNANTGSN